MKFFICILIFGASFCQLSAQSLDRKIDSLQRVLNRTKKINTQKVDVLNELSREYFIKDNSEKALFYAEEAEQSAKEIHYKIGEANAVRNVGNSHYSLSDYRKAIEFYKKSLQISEEINYSDGISSALGNIGAMYNELSDYHQAIDYYRQSLEISKTDNDAFGMGLAFNNIGLANVYLSDYPKAVEAFQEAIKIAEKTNDRMLLVKSLNNMGFLYSELPDYPKSLKYAQEALAIYRKMKDQKGEAYALNNMGNITAKMSSFKDQQAIEYYKESLAIAEQIDDKMSKASVLGGMGEFYFNAGDYVRALDYSQRALDLSKKIGHKNGLAVEYNSVAKSYLKLPDSLFSITQIPSSKRFDIALKYADSALILNKEIGNISGQRNAFQTLTEIYLHNTDYKNGYLAYRNFVLLNDSIQGEQVKNDILRKEMEFEFDKRTTLAQEEQEKRNITQRNIRRSLLTGLIGLLLFSGILTRQRNKLKHEKKRSENLLLNILPAEVADELKQTGKTKARRYDNISILFTDFVNFTQTSENLPPEILIEELNECFTTFDHIVEKHGLEKIKTIGDAYMAVCGLPIGSDDHAQKTIRAALEIADYIEQRKRKEKVFEIRIGINSGAVVAGIVGVKKFAYDIWGDSVNIAARMEQNGFPGKVNISEATFQLVKNDFACHFRGEIEAKNKGKLKMYFVSEQD